MKNWHRCLLLAAVGTAMAGPAFGVPQLEEDSTITVTKGTGQGAVLTMLTIQHTGTETGCVARSGGADVTGQDGNDTCAQWGYAGVYDTDPPTDETPAQSHTRQLSELGAGMNSWAQVAIAFDVSQAGNGSVHLDDMQLIIYNTNGSTCNLVSLNPTSAGNYSGAGGGQTAAYFKITDIGALQVTCAFDAARRVGLAAKASPDADDGPESWWLGRIAVAPPPTQAQLCAEKAVTGGNADQLFTFTPNPGGTPAGSQQTSANGGAVCWTFGGPFPKNVQLLESAQQGWVSGGVNCNNQQSAPGNVISVDLTEGNTVTCTFINDPVAPPGPIPPAPAPVPAVGPLGLGALALMLVGLARRRMR